MVKNQNFEKLLKICLKYIKLPYKRQKLKFRKTEKNGLFP